MNKKKTLIIITICLIIILIIVGYIIFYKNLKQELGKKPKSEMQNNKVNSENDKHIVNNYNSFDFETKTVTLNNGYKMPLNGIGTYSLTGDECYNSIKVELNSGVRIIDTAYMYHNEEEIGMEIRD